MNTGKLIVIRKFNQDADWTRTDAENWALDFDYTIVDSFNI